MIFILLTASLVAAVAAMWYMTSASAPQSEDAINTARQVTPVLKKQAREMRIKAERNRERINEIAQQHLGPLEA